jgi:hypothetical protein
VRATNGNVSLFLSSVFSSFRGMAVSNRYPIMKWERLDLQFLFLKTASRAQVEDD